MIRLATELYQRHQTSMRSRSETSRSAERKLAGAGSGCPPTSGPVIEVAHLQKTYGNLRAVNDVSFTVRAGEVFSFLGPNGAGKSTTVEILEGLRDRSRGEVRVLGLDPWTDFDRLKARIGVIPQDFHFFPKLTPREALRLYARLFDSEADPDELLALVELSDKADDHYDTLSGGQHQKLAVALSLVNDPEVCFLDEPTTGLDPRARRSIWEVVRRLRKEGRSVFLTTHYLEEAQMLSDRIGILNLGRIIATGTPDSLISQFGRPERIRIVGDPALSDRLRPLGLPISHADGWVEIELTSKNDALPILQAVSTSGLRWESFSTVNDSLEDVFIRLVGRAEENRVPTAFGGGVAS